MNIKGLKKETSNRPKDDPFHQHQLCGIHIFLDAKHVFPMLFVVGIIFICIGIWLKSEIDTIQEYSIDYTNCQSLSNPGIKCSDFLSNPNVTNSYGSCSCLVNFTINSTFQGVVNFYYSLTNFYQNYRLYVTSKDDIQLHGGNPPFKAACAPYLNDPVTSYYYAPCGAIANSLFNDTFQLYYISSNSSVTVPWTNVNISWLTDRTELYGTPSSFANTTKPINWKNTALTRSASAYKGDEELIVWMRVAAFPNFRKLHRLLIMTGIFSQGLVQGNYSLYINYSFPVQPFNGTKGFLITTPHWLDSKDPAIYIIFIVSGCCHIIASSILFTLYQIKTKQRRTID